MECFNAPNATDASDMVDAVNAKVSEWFGYRRLDFCFENREAIVVLPDKSNGHWMIKNEYFGAFSNTELALVKEGYTLTYLRNNNRWGTDDDHAAKVRFADYISAKLGLRKRFVQVGMSCGGLIAVNFASRYPEYVSFLYLDAPVLNLLSCPMGFGEGDVLDGGWNELSEAYGFTLSDLVNYREHPMDRLEILTDNKLPCAIVYGEADSVVPFNENGIHLVKHYRECGMPLFVYGKPGCGHHPHGIENPETLVRYIIENEI